MLKAVVITFLPLAMTLASFGLVPLLGEPPSMPFVEAADVGFGEAGLASLKYGGFDFLDDATFDFHSGLLTAADGTVAGAAISHSTTHEVSTRTTTQVYPWGTLSCTFKTDGPNITLHVLVQNTSQATLDKIQLTLPVLKFPSKPAEYDGSNPILGTNVGAPTALMLNYGTGVCVVTNENVTQPLLVAMPWAYNRPTSTIFPLIVNTGRNDSYPNSVPYVTAPIAPGAQLDFTLSLRFGPPSSTLTSIAGDIFEQFAAAYPFENQWSDHRSIGTLFLASSSRGFAKNPRGWFGDSTVDTTTPAGVQDFKTRLLAYADRSIAILKSMDSQGMITWDCEGQEFPHAISYIGDPRLAEERAPEISGVLDEYFRRFRAAGLRVGICIRPQQLVVAANGASAVQRDLPDATQLLIDKIGHAKTCWGATLFYLDSNGDQNDPTDAVVIERVMAAHPDILLIPEAKNIRYYRSTAPYQDLQRGIHASADGAKGIYPQSFSAIYTPNAEIEPQFDALVQRVRRGDILMYRGWYDAGPNATVKRIYDTAAQ